MVRLKFDSKDRLHIYSYLNNADVDRPDTEELLNIIDSNSTELNQHFIRLSLLKDMINIQSLLKKVSYSDSKFIMDIADKTKVNNEQLSFIQKTIENDRMIFRDDVDDSMLSKNFSNIISTAGAFGIPLAALYLTGSVSGLSAAGITSGLSVLGFGGILGFSSLVTGLGVLLALSLGINKGLKILTGGSEIDKMKRKEFLLQCVVKQHQRSVNTIIEDVSFISDDLTATYMKYQELSLQKDKLVDKFIEVENLLKNKMRDLASLTNAVKILKDKQEQTKIFIDRIQIPKELNIEKLRILTDEPVKKKFYDMILSYYDEISDEPKTAENVEKSEDIKTSEDQEKSEELKTADDQEKADELKTAENQEQIQENVATDEVKTDGDKNPPKIKWILKKDISLDDTEELMETFQLLGYFSIGGLSKQAKSKAVSVFKGIFK
jgi:hypothetical protein